MCVAVQYMCLKNRENVIKSILESGKLDIPEFKESGKEFTMPCTYGHLKITHSSAGKTKIEYFDPRV